jgi:putative alpha-1,2-mannosidase
VVGAPLFPKATVQLENGKRLSINARGDGRYVDKLAVGGRAIERNWLGHEELTGGATLDFSMSAQPNTRRGTKPADAPYSFSLDPKR